MKEDIIELKYKLEERRNVEEGMRKHYLEKEGKCQRLEVKVSILKGKLEEKGKHLKFQNSAKIFDNILSSQRYPSIKFGLGFHETVKGESSSQDCARTYEINKANYESPGKEMRNQPDQHLRKINFQRKSFTPYKRSIN